VTDPSPNSCRPTQGCNLSKTAAAALYADIAVIVGRIAGAERAAVHHVREGLGKQRKRKPHRRPGGQEVRRFLDFQLIS
jgi:hypothetical protein